MSKIQLPKNHHFLLVGHEIDQILTPLKRYGIKTLTFMRNYDSGHQLLLSNNSNYVEDYYHENLCGNFISGHPKKYIQKFLVVPNESPLLVHKICREKYNEGNTFCLVQRYEQFTEFFFFAGTVDNTTLTNFFLNNINLFETFAIYFKSAAEKIITRGEENRLLLDTRIYTENLPQLAQSHADIDSIKAALKEMKIKHFKFTDSNIKLTQREIDCIAAYQQDMTAKQTAQALDVSFRTIEKYFDTLNKKLNFNDKKETIKHLIELGFPDKALTYATYMPGNKKSRL